MTDALSLIRQYTIAGKPIVCVDDTYVFGDCKFNGNDNTCFKRTLKADDFYYKVKDVVFFSQHSEAGLSDYRRMCIERKITAVVEQDRPNLRGYLMGQLDSRSCPQIDLTVLAKAAATQASNARDQNNDDKGDARNQAESASRHRSREHSHSHGHANASKRSRTDADEEHARFLAAARAHLASEGLNETRLEEHRRSLALARSGEIPAQTRSSILSKPGALFNDTVLRPKSDKPTNPGSVSDGPARPTSASRAGSGNVRAAVPRPPNSTNSTHSAGVSVETTLTSAITAKTQASAPRKYERPIIIVPAALTGVLSLLNAAELLGEGRYVSLEERKRQGGKREAAVLLRRALPGVAHQEYKLIDSGRGLTMEDWEGRVAAVFVSGQSWQFKDWVVSDPAQLFTRVLGVHLAFENSAVDPSVASLNCKILKINQFKRHNDAGVANEFWSLLDDFVRLHKPWLAPAPSSTAPRNVNGSMHSSGSALKR